MTYHHGVEPKKPNNATELFLAIAQNDEKKVKGMVEGGLLLLSTMDQDEQVAIHVAAQQSNFPLFAYFLKSEPGLADAKDKHGRKALHIAAKKGNLDMIKHLVDVYKMDVRDPKNILNKDTIIHTAAELGYLRIIKWYIDEVKPFKPDLRNEEGETLLMSAAKTARLPIVKYLVEYGYANPFLLDNYDANVLFHSAVIGDLSVPKYLMDEAHIKFDVDWKNFFGITVVYMATRFHQLDFIKYFVEEKKALVDIGNNFGSTPLHEAAQEGDLNIVKYLIEHKAGFAREDMHGDTPAKVSKSKAVIEYLAEVAKKRKEEWEEYQRSRARRSVSELFVQRAPHPQTPIPCRWLQKRINDQFSTSSANQVVDGSVAPSSTVDTSFHLDSFLMLAGACAKYVTGVTGSEPAKHQSLLSPQELLREREDPIAFDAIDAMYDFEYPFMNDDDQL